MDYCNWCCFTPINGVKWAPTPWKINMEHNHGGLVQMLFLFILGMIFRFQPLNMWIFGVCTYIYIYITTRGAPCLNPSQFLLFASQMYPQTPTVLQIHHLSDPLWTLETTERGQHVDLQKGDSNKCLEGIQQLLFQIIKMTPGTPNFNF